ncbi:hypothetical protein NDU88_002935 [Pleurodeles waltl]|uniref:Uncharacterized protein n=1 Tax=Pleurodeles waltl TaxID=8319 RepID=A0AAV7M5G3_PLEWA|nr:hypothetical protein NDU88_002935 [Pleurodeles waltl]
MIVAKASEVGSPLQAIKCAYLIMGVILSLAGGGRRQPNGNRQKTVPRTKDRGGHSEFPAGLAGDRQKAARPAGNPLPRGCRLRMEPAEWKGCDGCSCTRRDFQCLLCRH